MGMTLPAIGGAGVGLVWGWLIGTYCCRTPRPMLKGLLLSSATLILAGRIILLVDWWAMVLFLGAAGLASFVYRGWRHGLQDRFGIPRG